MSNQRIVLVAHNIRSLWNIGSLFRSADAFSVSHIHLTGYTATPPRPEITKTALSADNWISWSKDDDPIDVIAKRKSEGFAIVSLEISSESLPLHEHKLSRPICIILGHEILGVPEELQRESDATVHIPMLGKKNSLNVSVAAGVALFHYRYSI